MATPKRINSNTAFPACVLEGMSQVFTIGKTLYEDYIKTRIVYGSKSVLDEKITKNMLKLPSDANY